MQIVFDRRGAVRTLALVPDRREGMPAEIEIASAHNKLYISALDTCYEPVVLTDAARALREGVDWRGRAEGQRWRWVLSGRELYVLAPGDQVGLHGFVSTARLLLGERHAVLATARLRNEVLTALAEAGCADPEISEDATPGVPTGWVLFRDVIPNRAVRSRDEAHILNALCPVPDVKPRFVDGIRLEGRTWLAGFPPRIRFIGELGNSFSVMIDGNAAEPAADGAFEAPGWDDARQHRLWFGDQTLTYALRVPEEDWDWWPAYCFGTAAAVCGASIQPLEGNPWRQARVPAANPILVGARQGEIFHNRPRDIVREDTIMAVVPFAPVWALPGDVMHADKQCARIVLLQHLKPVAYQDLHSARHTTASGVDAWAGVINAAARKGLALTPDGPEAMGLWRQYRAVAKQLWRRSR